MKKETHSHLWFAMIVLLILGVITACELGSRIDEIAKDQLTVIASQQILPDECPPGYHWIDGHTCCRDNEIERIYP